MSFSQPAAGGDNFTSADHNGHLILMYPKSYKAEEQTTKGLTQAADVDIVIVDKYGPDGAPLVFRDARVFGNLARSVRNDIGGKVLGRLGQVPTSKGSPAWVLANFTDQDAAAATAVAAAFEAGQFAQPTNPMAAPTPPTPAVPAPVPPQMQQSWNGAPAAPAPQAAPPAPTQQWQQPQAPAAQWNAPAPAAAAPPTPTATSATPAYDPQLVAFLQSKGITPPADEATARAIAAAL